MTLQKFGKNKFYLIKMAAFTYYLRLYFNFFQEMWRSTFIATKISALIYNSNKAACHLRSLVEMNYFTSNLKMTVFTYYLEIVFNFFQGVTSSIFKATIVSASSSNGRIFASLRMFSVSPLPNDCRKWAACFFVPSLQEQIDNSFFTKSNLLCKVLLLTLSVYLYAIGVDDSTRSWKYETECLYET